MRWFGASKSHLRICSSDNSAIQHGFRIACLQMSLFDFDWGMSSVVHAVWGEHVSQMSPLPISGELLTSSHTDMYVNQNW